MPKSRIVAGTQYDFPDDYSDQQVQAILTQQGIIKPTLALTPGGPQAMTKQSDLPIDWSAVGRAATEALPALGAAGMVMAGPEGWIPAIGLAALGGGGGEASRQLINRATGGPAPATSTEAATDIGKEALFNAAAEGGGRAVASGVGALMPSAERMYQSALKPRGSLDQVKAVVQTGLREGIPVSEQGLNQTGALIDSINSDIMQGIRARQAQGLTIDPNAVNARVDSLMQRYGNTLDKQKAQDVIDQVKQRLLDLTGSRPIPVEQAQAMKQAEGQLVREAYGKPFFDVTIEDRARQQVVRGLKEEIENVFPEIKSLNAREGQLINLEKALTDFVKREGNKPMSSFGTSVRGLAVAAATGNPHMALEAMLLSGALEDPAIKSRIALGVKFAASIGKVKQAVAPVINMPNLIRGTEAWMNMYPHLGALAGQR